MKMVVIKSRRRRKTASAQIRNGSLYIRLPAAISHQMAQKMIEKFRKRFRKKNKKPTDKNLSQRARRLNQRYFNGTLNYSIQWSARQNFLFGSCSFKKGTIRISAKLFQAPSWVQDATIMHELTHLVIPRHGKKFWQIANQYPLMERARGYLLALSRKTT